MLAAMLIVTSNVANAQSVLAAPASPTAHPATSHAGPPAKKTYAVGPSQAVCTAYLGRLRSKLVNNWYLPDGSNNVTLTMTVNNDGSTGEVKPASSPQNASAETAAMDALSKCQPLEPLPTGFPGGAKLTISFVSKADPHGDSNSSVNLHIDPVLAPKQETAAGGSPSSAATTSASSGAGSEPASQGIPNETAPAK